MKEKIDFVIPWVDGNDIKWQEEKNIYNKKSSKDEIIRYRDWDNLKYWFRAVEKYAPWVNKIYFITWGHIPQWLNTENPKLHIVNHKDYIPKEYLPTFSSHTIELNIHRIKDLEEKFVYFNDDTFLNDYVEENDFFFNNKPCESAVLNAIVPDRKYSMFQYILMNGIECINAHFNMKESISKNKYKWYNSKYGISNLYRNIVLSAWPNFPGIKFFHLPTSFLKSTFQQVWKEEYDILNKTCMNKFRTNDDVNQYIMKDWQLASGEFYPRTTKFGKYYEISDNNIEMINDIKKGKHKMICINDSETIKNFEDVKEIINTAFEVRLNEKCSYEK